MVQQLELAWNVGASYNLCKSPGLIARLYHPELVVEKENAKVTMNDSLCT